MKVALAPDKYLRRAVDTTLSGGERGRVELASVLAMKPKLVILDEPDSGIDALSIGNIVDVIRTFVRTRPRCTSHVTSDARDLPTATESRRGTRDHKD